MRVTLAATPEQATTSGRTPAPSSRPGEVILPVALQAEAAMRVFALAQGMGCALEWWEEALGDQPNIGGRILAAQGLDRRRFERCAEPPERPLGASCPVFREVQS